MIAGLDRPDAGIIEIDGRLVFGPGVDERPHERCVGMVFQDGALFPHMTVLDNVAYGLGVKPDLARARAALKLVDLEGVEDRLPETLSGGQRQRVALARAIAPEPRVLLLDEPLASLDSDLRTRIRSEIADLLHRLDITAVFVTHDQEEAFVVGDVAAVMKGGRVLQMDTPSAIYDAPVDAWVARFVGDANLVEATGDGDQAITALGRIPLKESFHGDCVVVIRPEYLSLTAGTSVSVESVEYYGHDTSYSLSRDGSRYAARLLAGPAFGPGALVDVRYSGPPVIAFPRVGANA
jgi:iron(III) transport system ATP-binding protein